MGSTPSAKSKDHRDLIWARAHRNYTSEVYCYGYLYYLEWLLQKMKMLYISKNRVGNTPDTRPCESAASWFCVILERTTNIINYLPCDFQHFFELLMTLHSKFLSSRCRQFISDLDPRRDMNWVLMKEKSICQLYKNKFSCDFSNQSPV